MTTAPAVDVKDAPALSHRTIMVIFSGLMICLFLSTLDQTIVATILFNIVHDIGGTNGLSLASWVVTTYLLASTAVTPLYGKISDQFGRRPVYLVAVCLFVVGSVLCAFAQNMPELLVFRCIQGLGGGGLTSLAFTIMGDLLSPRERGKYQGLFYGVFTLGTAAGPLAGGLLSPHTIFGASGWRLAFFVSVPFGLVAMLLIAVLLRLPNKRRPHNVDYVGMALSIIGVTALLLVTSWGGHEFAWTSPLIIGLAIVGVVILVAFVGWERRAPEPVIPIALFRNPIFSVSNSIALIMGVCTTGVLTFVALFLQVINNDSPTVAGLSLLPLMVGLLFVSIVTGWLITKTGRYKIFPIIGLAVAAVGLVLLSRLDEKTTVLERDLYMTVIGIGMGMVMQVLTVSVQNSVERKDLGAATAVNPFARAMGGAFGTTLFGALLANQVARSVTRSLNGQPLPDGYKPTELPTVSAVHSWPAPTQVIYSHAFADALSVMCLTAAGFVVVAFILSLFLKELPLRTSTAAPAKAAPSAQPSSATAPAKV